MTEFWAAIIGALVGSLSGGSISYWLQATQYKRERNESQKALAQSLLFKLVKVFSDLEAFRRHIEDSDERAVAHKLEVGWQSMQPIANGPAKLSFSSEELSYLLSLGDDDLFNDVLSLDTLHASTIDIFALYGARRSALTASLPAEIQGQIGQFAVASPAMRQIAPLVAEVESITEQIRERAANDAATARTALNTYVERARPKLGQKLAVLERRG